MLDFFEHITQCPIFESNGSNASNNLKMRHFKKIEGFSENGFYSKFCYLCRNFIFVAVVTHWSIFVCDESSIPPSKEEFLHIRIGYGFGYNRLYWYRFQRLYPIRIHLGISDSDNKGTGSAKNIQGKGENALDIYPKSSLGYFFGYFTSLKKKLY